DRPVRSQQRNITIDGAGLFVATKGERLDRGGNRHSGTLQEIEASANESGVRAWANLLDLAHDHVPEALLSVIVVVFEKYFFLPEIQAINVAMTKVKRALMRLKGWVLGIAATRVVALWKVSGHNRTGGAANGHKERLGEVFGKVVSGTWFSTHRDI